MWNIFKLLSYSCCWQWTEKARKLVGTVFSHSGQLADEVYLSSYTQREHLSVQKTCEWNPHAKYNCAEKWHFSHLQMNLLLKIMWTQTRFSARLSHKTANLADVEIHLVECIPPTVFFFHTHVQIYFAAIIFSKMY